jgi:hypothetical protein
VAGAEGTRRTAARRSRRARRMSIRVAVRAPVPGAGVDRLRT